MSIRLFIAKLFHKRALMQIDGNYLDVVIRFVCFRICFCITDLLTHFHALYNSSKYRMFVIQPWLWKPTKENRKKDDYYQHIDLCGLDHYTIIQAIEALPSAERWRKIDSHSYWGLHSPSKPYMDDRAEGMDGIRLWNLRPISIRRLYLSQLDHPFESWNLWSLDGIYAHCNSHFCCARKSSQQFSDTLSRIISYGYRHALYEWWPTRITFECLVLRARRWCLLSMVSRWKRHDRYLVGRRAFVCYTNRTAAS